MTGGLPFCWITADHQSLRCSARGEWGKVCSWEIRVLWLSAFVVLIILECRSATPSHTDLPFTHNTLTFSFACLCRHCPIRIHHTHRLSHADFDVFFFFSLTVSQLLFFYCQDLFVSSAFSPRLYCIAISLPEYYLLGSSADRFWMSHPACLIPSAPSVCSSPPISPRWCSFIASLSLKGQRREWHLSTRTLSLLLFLCAFFRLPHLRQSDIYKGTLHLFGSPWSFWWKNTEGSGSQGVVKKNT